MSNWKEPFYKLRNMAGFIMLIFLSGIAVRIFMAFIPDNDVVPVVEETDILGNRVSKVMTKADDILNRYVPFYVALSAEGKDRFKRRVRYVLATKRFYAPKGEKLTAEKLVLTAAGQVQMTFGLENWSLPYIRKFIIYDELVSERYFKHDYKGLTNGSGTVRLSWKYIRQGFMNPIDGVNLSLHELAHGIEVSIKQEQHVDEYIARAYEDFNEHFLNAKDDQLVRKLELFSDRDLQLSSEFFASSVELFFEKPADLRAHHPELYDLMRYCFKLDPMRSNQDFRLEDSELRRLEDRFGERLRKKNYMDPDQSTLILYVIQFFILSGIFVGVPIAAYKMFQLINPFQSIVASLLILLLTGLVIFKKRMLDSGYTSPFSYGVFLVMGWLPITFSLLLVLNDLFIIDRKSEAYSIARAFYNSHKSAVEVVLDGVDDEKYFTYQRLIPPEYIPLYKSGKKKDFQFVVHSARGIFMMDIYEGASLVKKRT